MAKGQLTYLQLINRVLLRLGKSQIVSADFAGLAADSWGGLVKTTLLDAQQALYLEADWSTLITSGTFPSSLRTYDLAASFSTFGREIDLVDTTNDKTLTPTLQIYLDQADPDLDDAGAPDRYSIQYPDLLFDLTPTSVSYRLRYVRRPVALSAVTDVSDLPEVCDRALVLWTVWEMLSTREDDPTGARIAGERYGHALNLAKAHDKGRMDRLHVLQAWRGRSRLPTVRYPTGYPAE